MIHGFTNPPRLANIKFPVPGEHFFAEALYDRISNQIRKAEHEAASRNQQVALFCCASGENIRVSNVGYHNTTLIVVDGSDPQGRECRGLIHVAAFSMLLKFIPREASTPMRKIGFRGEIPEPTEG